MWMEFGYFFSSCSFPNTPALLDKLGYGQLWTIYDDNHLLQQKKFSIKSVHNEVPWIVKSPYKTEMGAEWNVIMFKPTSAQCSPPLHRMICVKVAKISWNKPYRYVVIIFCRVSPLSKWKHVSCGMVAALPSKHVQWNYWLDMKQQRCEIVKWVYFENRDRKCDRLFWLT